VDVRRTTADEGRWTKDEGIIVPVVFLLSSFVFRLSSCEKVK